MELCGKCGKGKCECPKILEIEKREAAKESPRATGKRLEEIARKYELERGLNETDIGLRARVQMSVILKKPWRSGILAGNMLDKAGQRHGFPRLYRESDEDYRVAMMMHALGIKNDQRAIGKDAGSADRGSGSARVLELNQGNRRRDHNVLEREDRRPKEEDPGRHTGALKSTVYKR